MWNFSQNELFLKIFKVKIWFQNRRSKFKKQIKSMNTTGGSEQRSPNIHRQSDMGQSGKSEKFYFAMILRDFKMLPRGRPLIGYPTSPAFWKAEGAIGTCTNMTVSVKFLVSLHFYFSSTTARIDSS